MKKIITVLFLSCTIGVIFLGNMHWKENIDAANSTKTTINKTDETVQKKAESNIKLLDYTTNWPQESIQLYKEKLQSSKPFTILIAGSTDIDNANFHLVEELKSNLKKTYGDTIQVIGKSYNVTSTQFVEQNKLSELQEVKADMILMEPFTRQDNYGGQALKTLQNLNVIVEKLTENNNTRILFFPSNPIFQATRYPLEIENMRKFAEEHNILYINHWENWPDYNSNKILTFLTTPDGDAPNEEGYKLWSSYITNYLIHKK